MRRRGRAYAGLLLLAGALCWGKSAAAEVVLLKTDGFEFYTEGRLGGFFEAVQGQTLPTQYDQNGNLTHTIGDGGLDVGGLYTTLPMGADGQATRIGQPCPKRLFGKHPGVRAAQEADRHDRRQGLRLDVGQRRR